MAIAIIGASGKVGTLLVAEALKQNYKVTAIVRNRQRLHNQNIAVLEKSIFDLTKEDLQPFDAVINAYKAPEGQEADHIKSTEHLIKLFEGLPNTRLLVVGGAGSLYVDPQKTLRLVGTPNFPEIYKPTATNMGKAFDVLKKSSIQWTYMSPSAFFDVEGPATGKYTLGKDHVMKNSEGNSYVSYADYSKAMIDELKNKAFIRERFTVVSEKQ